MDERLPEGYERDMFMVNASPDQLVKELPQWMREEIAEAMPEPPSWPVFVNSAYGMFVYANVHNIDLMELLREFHEDLLQYKKKMV